MTKEVTLEDGTIAEFPDNYTDAQIAEILNSTVPQSALGATAPSGQPPDASQPLGEQPPLGAGSPAGNSILADDPFPGVPLEVDGVTLTDDIRQAWHIGRTANLSDKDKKKLAARIAGRIASMQTEGGNFADEFNRSQGGAFLRSIGTGLFGIGDLAAATGTVLGSGGDISFGDALELQREFRHGLEDNYPLTSFAGELTGAVIGGGAAYKGLGLLAETSGAVGTAANALRFQPGQKFLNAGRAGIFGAGAGGLTEGITEGEPGTGAAIGGAAGPIGYGLAGGVRVLASKVKQLLEDPASRGLKALAKKIGIDPEEMARRFLEFKEVTGKAPSIADISNPEAVAELRETITRVPEGVVALREGAERSLRSKAGEVAEEIAGGKVTSTPGAQRAARNRVAKEQFALADEDPIEFAGSQVDELLSDPNLRNALPPPLRRQIDEILSEVSEGGGVTLPGKIVNNIRLALRDRGRNAVGVERVYNDLADEIEDVARSQSDNFARAIDEFSQRSLRAEGVDAGRKVISSATDDFDQLLKEVTSADTGAGLRVGARSGLSNKALEGVSQSTNLLKSITGDTGLARRLQAVLPPQEFVRIRKLAEVQVRAIENTKSLSPGVATTVQDRAAALVKDIINTGVVASGQTGGAFKAQVVDKLLNRLLPRLPKKVIQNMAKDIFDPTKTETIINIMAREGVSYDKILAFYATISTTSSILTTTK